MAIHIVTLLNLRFRRYVFGVWQKESVQFGKLPTIRTNEIRKRKNKKYTHRKTTTTTHNVRTRKKSGSIRKTTHRMPNNLYYLLYWDVTVTLSLTIYFLWKCSTKQIGCNQRRLSQTKCFFILDTAVSFCLSSIHSFTLIDLLLSFFLVLTSGSLALFSISSLFDSVVVA